MSEELREESQAMTAELDAALDLAKLIMDSMVDLGPLCLFALDKEAYSNRLGELILRMKSNGRFIEGNVYRLRDVE